MKIGNRFHLLLPALALLAARTGIGIYYYANGDRYEGRFVGGLREGRGVYQWADGSRRTGLYENDQLVRYAD